MGDFLAALGLAFVIEGALYALFPEQMKRGIAEILSLPDQQVRVAGLIFAIFGALIIGVLKGL
jgi:uncharacterized protein YjeT (DUF2065 family)